MEENNIEKAEEPSTAETQAETTNLNYSPVKEKTVVAETEPQEDSKANSRTFYFMKMNHLSNKKGQSPERKEKVMTEKNHSDDEIIQKILKSHAHNTQGRFS